MNDRYNKDPETIPVYEIRLKGVLPDQWQSWFGQMSLSHDQEGNTILCGPVPDQAALYGLLDGMRDLGITLLSIKKLNQ